jgi:hypothetical protein
MPAPEIQESLCRVFHLKSYAGNITVEILLHMSLETAKEA